MDQRTPIYNFGAGPACLPLAVLERIKADIPDWHDGMSVMELSHRSPVMMELTQSIENQLRSLLAIPDHFAVLFMQGGARTQFSAIPLNLLGKNAIANYLVTGMWSKLAYDEATKYGQIQLVATGEPQHFTRIPDPKTWKVADNAAYFHYTDNETIHGVEFSYFPDIDHMPHIPPVSTVPHLPPVSPMLHVPHVSSVPYRQEQLLISDMTSSILTKAIDFSRFGLIYASAQKNLGISGITVVIVRKDLLAQAPNPVTPSMLRYDLFEQSHSLGNTPSIFCWYVLGLVLDWVQAQGGLPTFIEACRKKSELLYQIIDQSNLYHNPVNLPDRSRTNIPFTLNKPELESVFLEEASQIGLKQLKGHKAVGGIRASLYNAMPLAGVEKLAQFMQDFEKIHS